MKIGVMGAAGRMGTAIVETLIEKDKDLLAGGHVGRSKERVGQDLGSLCGHDKLGVMMTDQAQVLFTQSDIVIDFTSPNCIEENCQMAKMTQTGLVVGTTGLSEEHFAILNDASQSVPVVYAPNTSLGINILVSLVEQTARILDDDFDIEIFEAHHKFKKDAPSGTAVALGEAAAKGRGLEKLDTDVTDRNGERQKGDIGFSVMRGGDIVGEHNVVFAGMGERLELGHRAIDRKIFAKGAVHAALWLKDQKPGLYNMKDVLGLSA